MNRWLASKSIFIGMLSQYLIALQTHRAAVQFISSQENVSFGCLATHDPVNVVLLGKKGGNTSKCVVTGSISYRALSAIICKQTIFDPGIPYV